MNCTFNLVFDFTVPLSFIYYAVWDIPALNFCNTDLEYTYSISTIENMERSSKRRKTVQDRTLPTPPALEYDSSHDYSRVLDRAIHVLATESAALEQVTNLYRTDPTAQRGLAEAVEAVTRANHFGGKLVVCGVGKSAYIGMKLVATLKSLSIRASFMHACEAAHGDLGDICPNDVLLFISFSGKTPELLNLLPHLPDSTQIMAISSGDTTKDCPILADRESSVLIPAPIHQNEEDSFGVTAPTTSTTVALAVADMLALTIADQIHSDAKGQVFKRNHPGGAIGMNHREVEKLKMDGVEVSVLELPSPTISAKEE